MKFTSGPMKLRGLKVLALLAIAAGIYVGLLFLTGTLPEGSASRQPVLGAFVLWVALSWAAFGLATLISAIAHEPTRPAAYPGLKTGMAFIALFAVSLAVA